MMYTRLYLFLPPGSVLIYPELGQLRIDLYLREMAYLRAEGRGSTLKLHRAIIVHIRSATEIVY